MLEVIRLYDAETSCGRFMFSKELNTKYAEIKNLLRTELSKFNKQSSDQIFKI